MRGAGSARERRVTANAFKRCDTALDKERMRKTFWIPFFILFVVGCGRTELFESQEGTFLGTKRINVWCPDEFPRFPGDAATCRVAGATRGIILRTVVVREIADRGARSESDEGITHARVGKPFGFRCPDTFPRSTTDVAECTCEEQVPGSHKLRRVRLSVK